MNWRTVRESSVSLNKKSKNQFYKDIESYYKTLSIEELREAIDVATNKLKILLSIRAERNKLELN